MKKFAFYSLFLFLILQSCENENGWYGEGSKSDVDLNQISTEDSQKIEVNTNNGSLSNLPELLLNTSVSISNFQNKRKIGTGSGAFISNNKVVTNYHVIEKGNRIELIRNSDQKKFEGTVEKVDRTHDVCIIQIENETVEKFLKIKRERPGIATEIMVAGSPLGLNGTITKGNISRIARNEPYEFEMLQISAPISPGSSGGPVINMSGELVGISVGSLVGEGIQNVNFAVPSKYIIHLLED